MIGMTIWQLAGWTMLHFLWVGGAIGILAAIVRRAIRNASLEVRHTAALMSLALLVLAPGAIAWRLSHAGRAERPIPEPGQAPAADPAVVHPPVEASARPDRPDHGLAPIPRAAAPIAGIGHEMRLSLPVLASRLDVLAAWLPWLWLAGSPLTFAWLALGLAGAERLRRRSVVLADGELPQACRRLAEALGIARVVALAVCDRIAAPVLVGVVRPLILLPATALGCWSPEQLEMVMLHELAHVRRWDNLINLAQRLVESVLFFQPAVWFVSGWLRQEREHCCDRIVVAQTGRAHAYAETLLALAVPEPDRVPRAAVALTGNHLVSRIRQILVPREEHPMKLSRSLIVVAGVAVAAPAFWIAAMAQTQSSQKAQTSQTVTPASGQAEPAKPKDEKAPKPAVVIQGKPLVDWIAALKDRDPAARKRAVEVLGTVTGDQAGGLWSELQTAIHTTVFSDKDREVRMAAAAVADGFKIANAPAIKKRVDEERKRTVAPTLPPIRLVDAQGRPVSGAVVSHYFSRDRDLESSFRTWESIESKTSDVRGEVSLNLEIPGHLDGVGVFAIRQAKGRPLVGLHKGTREEIGKPITIAMHPACRVLFRIESTGFLALEKKYNAELTGPGWWRAAYLELGNGISAPRPLFTSSMTGELEFLLPPGRFTVMAYGSDVKWVERPVEIKQEDKELFLGTIDLAPSRNAEQGRFPDHHRVRTHEDVDEKGFAFRRIRSLSLHGSLNGAHDVAFSPDGKLLATAHSYNADPSEVKLWDTTTGALLATLSAPDRGVVTLAFSPDGKLLAGKAHLLSGSASPWEIILWEVASRRETRTFRGHTGRIKALAFSPDGKTLASSGADKTTRFWEIASGRETGRIENSDVWRWTIAYAPDGQTLATIGTGAIQLWDVAGRRLRATLEPRTERFAVESVAYAPDGRTVAAAGSTYDAKETAHQGQVRLYDVAQEPFRRRAVLTFDRDRPGGPNQGTQMCSDVAFTPDGRRVVAVGMQTVMVWDVATGTEQSSFGRDSSSSSDQIAVSPDGRWLAITGPSGIGIMDIPPTP
jgi:WD40 repeat protein/beta-lactamase regulating signal transducer with metallopeptidase domain